MERRHVSMAATFPDLLGVVAYMGVAFWFPLKTSPQIVCLYSFLGKVYRETNRTTIILGVS